MLPVAQLCMLVQETYANTQTERASPKGHKRQVTFSSFFFSFLFCFVLFFKTGFLCVALTVPELALDQAGLELTEI